MLKCPGCGEDNPPKFRLCGFCGTALAAAAAPLPAREVRKSAVMEGMHSLREDGWRLVREGLTTVQEVLRVTKDEQHVYGESKGKG